MALGGHAVANLSLFPIHQSQEDAPGIIHHSVPSSAFTSASSSLPIPEPPISLSFATILVSSSPNNRNLSSFKISNHFHSAHCRLFTFLVSAVKVSSCRCFSLVSMVDINLRALRCFLRTRLGISCRQHFGGKFVFVLQGGSDELRKADGPISGKTIRKEILILIFIDRLTSLTLTH